MTLLHLLLQMTLIVGVGRLLGLAFRRVGQPAVIAEIVAGILLGPSLLGLVSPDLFHAVFPASALTVLSMTSQLGLVFFMFLVGLEFDLDLLRGQGRASLMISNAGILAPFLMGAALSLPLHASLAPEGVPRLTFALFMGTAMSITAFPVLARILAERRLIRTRVGAIALASAAFDDVTAWCLLAVVVAVAGATGLASAAGTVLGAAAYALLMWFGVRPALARIGPRAGTALSANVVALLFLVLLVSAAATEWIGIHALFGAFVFGVVVPREHGLASVMVEKLEDLVTIVLLPLFFAYSGLRTQISLLDSPSAWGTAAIIVVVATLGKFGTTALVARWSGLDRRSAAAVGVLMNTRGLMELVVLNIGLDLGVISPELFAMMVVMALVTTVATSPILERLLPEGGAPAPDAVAPPVGPSRPGLLLCLADPAMAPAMVAFADAWTRRSRADVWALHLTPVERTSEALRAEEPEPSEPLQAVTRDAAERGLVVTPLSYPSAAPEDDIVRIAGVKGVPLVVIGGHRSVLGESRALGGAARSVLTEAPCDVGVLLARGEGAIARVGYRRADAAVQRVLSRLREEGGVEVVEGAFTGVDLVVLPAADFSEDVTQGERVSWLLVHGAS